MSIFVTKGPSTEASNDHFDSEVSRLDGLGALVVATDGDNSKSSWAMRTAQQIIDVGVGSAPTGTLNDAVYDSGKDCCKIEWGRDDGTNAEPALGRRMQLNFAEQNPNASGALDCWWQYEQIYYPSDATFDDWNTVDTDQGIENTKGIRIINALKTSGDDDRRFDQQTRTVTSRVDTSLVALLTWRSYAPNNDPIKIASPADWQPGGDNTGLTSDHPLASTDVPTKGFAVKDDEWFRVTCHLDLNDLANLKLRAWAATEAVSAVQVISAVGDSSTGYNFGAASLAASTDDWGVDQIDINYTSSQTMTDGGKKYAMGFRNLIFATAEIGRGTSPIA